MVRLLARIGLVVGLLAISGCAAPVADSVTSEPFPESPETITAENAGEYAAGYEEVYRHNTILATSGVDDITSITAACNPTNVTDSGDGYRVTVSCGFGYMYEDDGATVVADGRPYEATYWVGGGLVERIGSTLVESP